LKRINFNDDLSQSRAMVHDDINMGTTLFELFLVLKRFVMLGTALCPAGTVLQISEFHQWFFDGVKHWLDISVHKAKTR
jgi:BAI1-associated protein 3